MNQHQTVAHYRTRQRLTRHGRLPGDGAVAAVQGINLCFFAAHVNVATGNGQAARQQCRFTGEPAVFFRQVNRPHFFSIIGVHRFHGTFAVSRIDYAVGKCRMQVGIEVTNPIAHGGAPCGGGSKLVFNRRQWGHFHNVLFATEQ